MVDIVINRCTLRLVRHGGWSWGPNPHKLREAATKLLPELIARKLADLFEDDEDIEITQPVRLAVKVKLADLLCNSGAFTAEGSKQSGTWVTTLNKQLEKTVAATTATGKSVTPALLQPMPSRKLHRTALTMSKVTPLSVLLNWRNEGSLDRMLSGFNPAALSLWHNVIFSQSPQTGTEQAEPILALAREIAATFKDPSAERETWLRLRITVAVEIVARQRTGLSGALLRRVLDQVLPGDDSPDRLVADKTHRLADRLVTTKTLAREAHPASPQADREIQDRLASHVPRPLALDVSDKGSEVGPLASGDVQVCSVLPFLILGVLSRLGYLELLSATLQVANLAHDAAHFAVALAHKVLTPPDRGWHRDPADRRAAAAFAGLKEPLPETDLAAFGRQITDALSPLDGLIARSLADGHNPNQPLLLYGIGSAQHAELLLVDPEGCFPVFWHDDLDSLLTVIHDFGPITVLITRDAALPETLRRLADTNVRFITDAPPSRGEQWRALGGRTRCWTNDHERHASKLIQLAQQLPEYGETVETLVQALIVKRPAIAPTEALTLERSVTLAAAAALGTIAWTLWGEREPTDPTLALARFGDLDGRVSFDAEKVRVHVPLGRRYQDLLEHGFFANIPDAPWLGGRVVEFT